MPVVGGGRADGIARALGECRTRREEPPPTVLRSHGSCVSWVDQSGRASRCEIGAGTVQSRNIGAPTLKDRVATSPPIGTVP